MLLDNGSHCGQAITITADDTVATTLVVDECPTCTNTYSVDISEAMFEKFTDLSVGELNITWKFDYISSLS
ncbi:hypothetical protein B0H13DRAFT_2300942 [Mycena leptocephala]|nr:hypothetical protein B0H13DRAFT_2300942 [Mycena leptocephala]